MDDARYFKILTKETGRSLYEGIGTPATASEILSWYGPTAVLEWPDSEETQEFDPYDEPRKPQPHVRDQDYDEPWGGGMEPQRISLRDRQLEADKKRRIDDAKVTFCTMAFAVVSIVVVIGLIAGFYVALFATFAVGFTVGATAVGGVLLDHHTRENAKHYGGDA